MAKTVSQAFQEFMQRYEPTPWQKETISKHHNYIRDVLSNKVDIVDDFLTGSYVKETQIKPPSDIDLFIVVNSDYFHRSGINTAKKLLDWFWNILKDTYPDSPLDADGEAVVVEFSDDIKMDVVPAFNKQGGGYLISNYNANTFISTNPKQYNDFLSSANQDLDNKLKPLIKMVKCWNVNYGNILNSFHIEILALNCFIDTIKKQYITFDNYQEGLKIFFGEAQTIIDNPSYDPIMKDRIDNYLDGNITIKQKSYNKRAVIKYFLQEHYKKIIKAIRLQDTYYSKEAIEIWKELFNDYFPSYY